MLVAINNDKLEVKNFSSNKKLFDSEFVNIADTSFSEKNNLIFISLGKEIKIIKIDPINLLIEDVIQTISIEKQDLYFNINSIYVFDKNSLVVYNKKMIFLFQKINGNKTYQLKSKLSL